MNSFPKYLIRPDDKEVFSINKDDTYTIESHKKRWPDHFHHSYSYQDLINLGFTPRNEN